MDCPIDFCEYKADGLDSLDVHTVKSHRQAWCYICGFLSASSVAIKTRNEHIMNLHMGQKYECTSCGRQYHSSGNCTSHCRTCVGGKVKVVSGNKRIKPPAGKRSKINFLYDNVKREKTVKTATVTSGEYAKLKRKGSSEEFEDEPPLKKTVISRTALEKALEVVSEAKKDPVHRLSLKSIGLSPGSPEEKLERKGDYFKLVLCKVEDDPNLRDFLKSGGESPMHVEVNTQVVLSGALKKVSRKLIDSDSSDSPQKKVSPEKDIPKPVKHTIEKNLRKGDPKISNESLMRHVLEMRQVFGGFQKQQSINTKLIGKLMSQMNEVEKDVKEAKANAKNAMDFFETQSDDLIELEIKVNDLENLVTEAYQVGSEARAMIDETNARIDEEVHSESEQSFSIMLEKGKEVCLSMRLSF